MDDTTIIILAAGKGTRMESDLPKCLMPLAGKPMILHLLETIKTISSHKPVVVIGYKKEMVQEALGDDQIYAIQEEQKGTAHATECALPFVNTKYVMVLLADMPFIQGQTIKDIVNSHITSGAPTTLPTITVSDFEGRNQNFWQFARILRDEAGKVSGIREFKYTSEAEKEIKELNPSFHVFNTDWLKERLANAEKENPEGEFYLTELVRTACSRGDQVNSFSIDPREAMGANTVEELGRLEKHL